MIERDDSAEYRRIFEVARLNASIRIQELDEAADHAALSMMVEILRPKSSLSVIERNSPKGEIDVSSKRLLSP